MNRRIGSVLGLVTAAVVLCAPPITQAHKHRLSASAAACTPTATLVNPCRPWIGAAASGNPDAAPDRISQFNYVEQLVGHPLDVYRDYTVRGSGVPLTANEAYFANRANTYIDINWKPVVTNWANADGSDSTVNAEIDKVAASIVAIAPTKVFLSIWHEPENDVSVDGSCPTNPNATAGSPAQYRAMWWNVETRFATDGVSNVVWVMDYTAPSNGRWDCMVPQLWPGNSLVQWVFYDAYSRSAADTWDATVGRFYNLLLADSTTGKNFAAKPFGLGEFGTCNNPDDAAAANFYRQGTAAISAGTYPNLKLYNVFDSSVSPGCLTNYSYAGQPDPDKQAAFNGLVSAVLGQ